MAIPQPDFLAILKVLVEHQVDFIVVGGVGAALHGAMVSTLDLDIVHSRTPENVDQLLTALEELEAFYREQPARRIVPQKSHLMSPGHQLLMTKYGPLDVLGTIVKDQGYQDLLHHTEKFHSDEIATVRVLSLPELIAIKEILNRDKDRVALPIMKRALEEQQKKTAPPATES
jgi:hypothetical protein